MFKPREQNEHTALKQLMNALNKCLALYTELIDTAQLKHTLIIRKRHHELGELIEREHELLQQFAHVDQSRKEAVASLQRARSVATDTNVSLTELINVLEDTEEQADLQAIQVQLYEASRHLQTLNEQNLVLLKQDVALIQDLLDGILGPAESDYVYEHPGSGTGTAKRTSGIDYRM